jgi:hypothetical protein
MTWMSAALLTVEQTFIKPNHRAARLEFSSPQSQAAATRRQATNCANKKSTMETGKKRPGKTDDNRQLSPVKARQQWLNNN